MKIVKSAFRPDVVVLRLNELKPTKDLHPRERKHPKYVQIAKSLETVGLIEPIVVFPTNEGYRILDGHKRVDILRQQNVEQTECIIGTKDEAYTYNRRVNYLSTVGEQRMIARALRHNSEETIAKALNVDVGTIRKKKNLLDGICKEAIDVLRARRVAPPAFAALRKMKPVRQVAAARLMVASNRFSQKFAQALLAGTSEEMLVEPYKSYKPRVLSKDQKARLIAETDSLLANIKAVEASYGEEALKLSVGCRYVERLLANKQLAGYLAERHREVLAELQSLVCVFQAESLQVVKAAGP